MGKTPLHDKIFLFLKKRALLHKCANIHRKYVVVACILDNKNNVLSVGENTYVKTHPVQAHYAKKAKQDVRIYLHAEIAAICRVRNGVPHKLFVLRIDSFGNLKLAKPCPCCALAIKETTIKKVYYSNSEKLVNNVLEKAQK